MAPASTSDTTTVTSKARYKPQLKESGRLPALPSLTGLRFLALFALFLFHSVAFVQLFPFLTSDEGKTVAEFFPVQLCASGVTFLFILFGFMVDWSYDTAEDTVRAFWRRRVLEIFPTHLLTAIAAAIILAVPLAKLAGMWPNFLLIHTWGQDWAEKAQLNLPAWILCSQLLFVFCFPLLVPLVNRIRGKAIWWAVVILNVLLLALPAALHFLQPGMDTSGILATYPPAATSPDLTYETSRALQETMTASNTEAMTSTWLSYQFPASRLLEFFLGVMFSRLVKSGMWRVTNLVVPLLVCVGGYVQTYMVPVEFQAWMVMLPLATLIATVAVRDINGRRGFLNSRLGLWLGSISFAFYMVGYPIQILLQRTIIAGRSWGLGGYVLITVLTLAVQLPLAAALYHWVDKPILSRWARRKPKSDTESPPKTGNSMGRQV
jgi:peptidoglycan/LPS O-acetylase OafA/YrhL